ncbi:MAG: hypothetical protein GPJ51_01445 [Candidatus Heimdallarchaeota archaeon]|nr:hypothetical protein [Candidatus Heimdallarchaeota archaeon]
MSLIDWFENLPPASLTDPGVKMLIYLLVIFTFLSALVVFITTRVYRKKEGPSLLDLDMDSDLPTPSDIPPSERIAILKIEKTKFEAAQQALSGAHRKKDISESVFGRLSVRYASDVKKIEDEIEKTAREAEVSQLEEELKKMQGDYLSKIKGEEKIDVPSATPATAPPTPPAPPLAVKPVKPPKTKKRKRGKAVATPPAPPSPAAPPVTGKAAPPPPPGVGKTPPPTAVPSPPMPTPIPTGAPATTPSIPAPTVPTPKPPGVVAPPAAAPAGGEGEGDLFAKSTSIAALRKEMLKELDRLKKFMSEQQ